MMRLSRQVTRYIIVGGLGTAAHLIVLTIGVERLQWDVVQGSIAGFLAALSVSFFLNHYWTFESQRSRLNSFWRYFVVSLSGLMLNTAMVYAIVEYLHWWYLTAQISVILVVPTSNFLLNRYWAFASNPD